MKLKVLGSSSQGNCYLLESSTGERLMLDIGFKARELKPFLNFRTSDTYCLLTHEDADHSKGVKDVLKMGIPVFSSAETFEELGVENHHNANPVKPFTRYKVGKEFHIVPFQVNHDVTCYGYLIDHEECGLTLFATDTYFIDYTFSNLNNVIIEANYSDEILDEKYGIDTNKRFLRDRVIESHFSLEHCIEFLQANDLTHVNNIILIHLSDTNSDEKMFVNKVWEATGKSVYVADAGKEFDLDKTPF